MSIDMIKNSSASIGNSCLKLSRVYGVFETSETDYLERDTALNYSKPWINLGFSIKGSKAPRLSIPPKTQRYLHLVFLFM